MIAFRGVLSINNSGIRVSCSYSSCNSTTVESVMMKSMWGCENRESTERDGKEDGF